MGCHCACPGTASEDKKAQKRENLRKYYQSRATRYSPGGEDDGPLRNPLCEIERNKVGDVTQINNYKVQDKAGQGAFGVVYLCEDVCAYDCDAERFAVKELSREAAGKRILKEIEILTRLRHPHVVRLVEVIDDPEQPQLFLVFEALGGGQLCEYTADGRLVGTRWAEAKGRRHFQQVVAGLMYLHTMGVLHRDIKPENIVFSDELTEVKLIDFGESQQLKRVDGDDSGRATVGTPMFQAPESMEGTRFSGKAADVWALGTTLFLVLCGQVPFGCGTTSQAALWDAIANSPLAFPEEADLSEAATDLLSRMLNKDPVRRITLAEVDNHEWFTGSKVAPRFIEALRPSSARDAESVERSISDTAAKRVQVVGLDGERCSTGVTSGSSPGTASRGSFRSKVSSRSRTSIVSALDAHRLSSRMASGILGASPRPSSTPMGGRSTAGQASPRSMGLEMHPFKPILIDADELSAVRAMYLAGSPRSLPSARRRSNTQTAAGNSSPRPPARPLPRALSAEDGLGGHASPTLFSANQFIPPHSCSPSSSPREKNAGRCRTSATDSSRFGRLSGADFLRVHTTASDDGSAMFQQATQKSLVPAPWESPLAEQPRIERAGSVRSGGSRVSRPSHGRRPVLQQSRSANAMELPRPLPALLPVSASTGALDVGAQRGPASFAIDNVRTPGSNGSTSSPTSFAGHLPLAQRIVSAATIPALPSSLHDLDTPKPESNSQEATVPRSYTSGRFAMQQLIAPDARSHVRLLIADDVYQQRDIMSRMAKECIEAQVGVSFTIDTAEDGDEAVRAVAAGHSEADPVPYTALLLDVHMPRLSGFEAAREIRTLEQREGWLEVPIFGVTADTQHEAMRDLAQEAGMQAMFFKPMTPEKMRAMLGWLNIITKDSVVEGKIFARGHGYHENFKRNMQDESKSQGQIAEGFTWWYNVDIEDSAVDMTTRRTSSNDDERLDRLRGARANLGAAPLPPPVVAAALTGLAAVIAAAGAQRVPTQVPRVPYGSLDTPSDHDGSTEPTEGPQRRQSSDSQTMQQAILQAQALEEERRQAFLREIEEQESQAARVPPTKGSCKSAGKKAR